MRVCMGVYYMWRGIYAVSLVPKNQVEFLGLAHTFATMTPSNDQTLVPLLGNKPKEFDFVHQTVFLLGGAHGLGTRLKSAFRRKVCVCMQNNSLLV